MKNEKNAQKKIDSCSTGECKGNSYIDILNIFRVCLEWKQAFSKRFYEKRYDSKPGSFSKRTWKEFEFETWGFDSHSIDVFSWYLPKLITGLRSRNVGVILPVILSNWGFSHGRTHRERQKKKNRRKKRSEQCRTRVDTRQSYKIDWLRVTFALVLPTDLCLTFDAERRRILRVLTFSFHCLSTIQGFQ